MGDEKQGILEYLKELEYTSKVASISGGTFPPANPNKIRFDELVDPRKILAQIEAVTQLLHTASAFFIVEEKDQIGPSTISEGTTFFVSDYFRILRQILDEDTTESLVMRDFWNAAYHAIQEGRCWEGDSFIGKGSLWACPVFLKFSKNQYPKAAIVSFSFPPSNFFRPDELVRRYPVYLANHSRELERAFMLLEDVALPPRRLEHVRKLLALVAAALSDEISTKFNNLQTMRMLKQRQAEVEELNETLKGITRQFALEKINVMESNARLEVQNLRCKEIFRSLQKDMDNIMAVHKLREELYNELSHELKTPLTTIRAFAEILMTMGEEEKENAQEFLKIIQDESERLAQLVDQMLSLARLEAGKELVYSEQIDLSELIHQVVRIFQARAKGEGITLEGRLSPHLPVVYWSRDQIHRLLMNLIDNAMRFTPSNGRIEIRAYPKQVGDRDHVVIEVEDNGPGIPEEKRKQIFHKFYSTTPSNKEVRKGTGLGLSICESIAKAHEGTITVEDGEMGGALFRVTLPVKPDSLKP